MRKDVRKIGLNRIEELRKELCINAELIDPNKVLHVLLRLMNARSRQKLEGKIGGAMLLLIMAEMLVDLLKRNLRKNCLKRMNLDSEFGLKVQGNFSMGLNGF